MKPKTSFILIIVAAMFILCCAVMALASSHNNLMPKVIENAGISKTVQATKDLSGINVIPERAERLQDIPKTSRATINR